jgi:hypothetical protein
MRVWKIKRTTGASARSSDSGSPRYTVMGCFEVIISAPVKSEPSKQRKSSSERMGYSLFVADSQEEVRNFFSS